MQTLAPTATPTGQLATSWLCAWIRRQLQFTADFDPDWRLDRFALDSTEALLLLADVGDTFGVRLQPTALWRTRIVDLAELIALQQHRCLPSDGVA